MHDAVATAPMSTIDMFLALPDFNPLQEGNNETTPIHHVAERGSEDLVGVREIVQKLLAHGIPMDVDSAYGTPPYYAIWQRNPEVALLLLDLGAQIQEPIERQVGSTILHQCLVHNACWPGSEPARLQVLPRLVSTGMDLEAESGLRETRGILESLMAQNPPRRMLSDDHTTEARSSDSNDPGLSEWI